MPGKGYIKRPYEKENGDVDYKYTSYRSMAIDKGASAEAYDKYRSAYARQAKRELELLGKSDINPSREAYLKVTGRHTAVEERRVALHGLSKEEYVSKYDRIVEGGKIDAVMGEVNELVDMAYEKYGDDHYGFDSSRTGDPVWVVWENIEVYEEVQDAYAAFKRGDIDSKEFWKVYHELIKTPHKLVTRIIYGDSPD